MRPWRPTRAQLLAARGKGVRDVIAPGLRVLFVGINPGLYTAAIGHHFGRPGNRCWKTLHRAGFTERELSPFEERELLPRRIGITNLVNRATASADELEGGDLRRGARILARKVRRYRPRLVAFLGMGAYRLAFGRPRAALGEQEEFVGAARVWVLPNPSGRTASYALDAMVRELRRLALAAGFARPRTVRGARARGRGSRGSSAAGTRRSWDRARPRAATDARARRH